MALKRISDLSAAATLDGTEEVPVVQAGATVKATAQAIADLASAGAGTVTSVDMSVPPDFAIAGNPVTTSGTLALTETTQAANTVKAGPASGASAAPTYRALVAADLPATAVTAGSYGDATHVGTFTVDAQGRLTAAASVAITGGGGGATAFTGLSDVPASYTGHGGEYVTVKVTEDGLQFTTGGGGTAWGTITGTLSSQTDLQAALDAKTTAPTTNNTVFGSTAFSSGTSAYNVVIGYEAGRTITGDGNVAIGVEAIGDGNCSGPNNVAIGRGALSANANGDGNVAVGWLALTTNNVSGANTAVGGFALESNLGGSNTAVGSGALSAQGIASYNVAVGQGAMDFITTGAKNTGVGTQCGQTITTGSQNIAIGYQCDVPTAAANGQMSIGNIIYGFGNTGTGATLSTGRIVIGSATDDGTNRLQVNGNVKASGVVLPGTTSQYVRGDGSLATLTALTNPMTAAGDMIVGGTSGAPTRTGVGSNGTVWTVVSGVPQWAASAGGGDMTAAVYDPAAIAQQVVGTTAVQTVTHKDLSSATNTFPTLNQNTTGSAATLTTARAINGVNFDGSAAVTVPSMQLVGVNDQTGTSYTLVLSDAGKDVRCTNASAIALTVPLNSSVAFPVGTMIPFSQGGAGAVTATAASGVTINAANGSATTAQYDARVLEKVGTDTWRVW